ncbi:hypothetical protein EI555_002182 [Monodon monoceros]|uniref:G-protein coupled receptors family 3 profile domain-containing protein n=1 Tax=Monodon monoceros TaxID=40151 RepID=A0A4U1FP46_MONMO|nr:hypothetical protein EI555_002182 [Monodon monoceros]
MKHGQLPTILVKRARSGPRARARPCQVQGDLASMLLWGASFIGLQLSLSCCWAFSCHSTASSSDFSLPGDYLLADQFPPHGDYLGVRCRPTVTFCDRPSTFNGHGYHLFQAMQFGIEEINNSTALLPNVTLGYKPYDGCSESANVFATLSPPGTCYVESQGDPAHYSPEIVAVIGPDASNYVATTAALLSPFLMPLISWRPGSSLTSPPAKSSVSSDASSVMLSVKRLCPSFLHTIPSDERQVEILMLLSRRFGWVWISMVGSEGDYGQLGVQALEDQATQQGICVAFKDTVPFSTQPGDERMQSVIRCLAQARTAVVGVCSSRQLARVFFESVVLAKLTAKVWIASEDWAISRHISNVPGIWGIGTVLGMATPQRRVPGLKEFEEAYVWADKGALGPCLMGSWCSSNQLCRECWAFAAQKMLTLGAFSMSSAYIYQAVYAVAHSLHQLLGCASGVCSRGWVYPWQLLEQILKVNFLLHKDIVTFNDNGDPLSSYNCLGLEWPQLDLQGRRLLLLVSSLARHKYDQKPSVCSSDCPEGDQRVIMGFHHCCFECVLCEARTFLNKSDPYSCQPCGKEEWAPERSQACFPCTVVFLTWHEPISWVLLAANTLLLLLVAGTAGLFAWHLDTPVVRSAGSRLCFLMLGSLAGGSCGHYGFFGEPTLPTCLLREGLCPWFCHLPVLPDDPLLPTCFSAKVPTFFRAWVQNHSAGPLVVISSTTQLLICLTWLAVWTPLPPREYQPFPQLAVSAFACSFLGKDLPENYIEVKCVTFSLLLNFMSWIAFFTMASDYQGKHLPTVNVLAKPSSLSGGFSDLNSTEHFQASTQDYTRRCGST